MCLLGFSTSRQQPCFGAREDSFKDPLEVSLRGNRLEYRKRSGEGPESGWVDLTARRLLMEVISSDRPRRGRGQMLGAQRCLTFLENSQKVKSTPPHSHKEHFAPSSKILKLHVTNLYLLHHFPIPTNTKTFPSHFLFVARSGPTVELLRGHL